MIECTINIFGLEQGQIDVNGKETESKNVLRSALVEVPRGLHTLVAMPTFSQKSWNSTEEKYVYKEYSGTGWSCSAHFYNADVEYLGRLSVKTEADCLKYSDAVYMRFTFGIGQNTIFPDDSTETKSRYYFVTGTENHGTAICWYYSNDRLTHEDMPDASEKAMKKPYPKALWRTDTGIPYHELFPIEKPCGAFMNAVSLEYVRIPESVRKIGRYAFFNTAMRKVRISSECEYYKTSFPEKCTVEFYEENGNEAVSGQTYDSDGHILIDSDGARIYTEG